ncbi:hypothetical protein SLEP1_g32005 [Rubroshorea leprosula]|uniref:Uncharacterized protein n=1 Tax=Rubroshorea leprosula TaxID=152421 RepID=A0AAV5KC17_9ROSI|nr:hypothetical protein SLEP1_g32005 [Rubroshorea leprosula]
MKQREEIRVKSSKFAGIVDHQCACERRKEQRNTCNL